MTDNKLKIWLVDDDDDDRFFFSEGLESLQSNTELKSFSNAKDAIISLEDDLAILPDMIFLDLNMPTMNGLESLEYIRKSDKLKNIIVAMYSTSCSGTDIQNAYEKGANLYIIKPSRFQDLINCLQKIMTMNWPDFLCNFTKENFILKV